MSRLPQGGANAPPPPAIDPDAMRAHAGEAVRLLKALGNEKRLMLLCMLVTGEQSVSELNAHLDLSQSALSQHLALLREDGLVQTRREAQSIFYSLADGPARRIISTLHSIYCAADAPQPEPSP
ncbi:MULTISPECIES: metalloregulator ArsR/SmtB family transcription factor [Lysobacter]|nr:MULTISPECIES: metalloregulator ArsR/SmtB family transcription factor [Lysobacter]